MRQFTAARNSLIPTIIVGKSPDASGSRVTHLAHSCRVASRRTIVAVQRLNPEDHAGDGLSPERRDAALAMVRTLPTTALLVLVSGRSVLEYGDIGEVGYVASIRKSVLSMLYGSAVGAGLIDLDATLRELDIDDVGGLAPAEREATVRHLLTASSGVYHPAAGPGGDDENLPPRLAHRPGTHFHYNNWDFNVLGTIYEQATGRSVLDALRDELAVPLGFRDFDRDRQRMLGDPQRSRHLAYHMFLSARDTAELGRLMLNGGRWGDARLVPAEWVRQSTSRRIEPGPNLPLDYGYLWWLPRMWPGSFLAAGNFGQFLFCLPSRNIVIVHRRTVSDEFAVRRNQTMDAASTVDGVSTRQFLRLVQTLLGNS